MTQPGQGEWKVSIVPDKWKIDDWKSSNDVYIQARTSGML